MSIDAAKVQWDAAPAIDLSKIRWNEQIPGGRKPTREELIAQIPGQDGQPVPDLTTPERELGVLESAVSLPLTAATVITGAPATIAGAWGELLGGKKTGQTVQRALTFPVYTEAQARQLQALGRTAEDLKIPPTLGGAGIPLNAIAGPALAQTTNAMRVAGGAVSKAAEPFVQQPLAKRAARIAQEESAKSWQRAPEIEAAQAAQRVGAVLNPARSNPTARNKTLVGAVGESNLNYEMSQKNLPVWNDTARRSLGLPENTPLDEAALNAYRDRNSTSHLIIGNMGKLENTDDAIADLGKMRLNPKSTSNPDKINAVNSVVDRVQSQIESGLTGQEVLDQIRGFRNDAKVTLRRADAKPADIDVAKANLKIADTLEKLIENNIADDSVVAQYRADRTALAKSYDWERAIDPITKQVDPNQLAADVRNGIKLTGDLKDLADVAGTYPEIASMRPVVTSDPYTMLRRGGVGGTIGFATLGGPEGAAIGAGTSTLAGKIFAKRMGTPEFQLKRAMPADKRLPLPPVEGMSRPDFVLQGAPYVPAQPVPNKMLGYNPAAPSAAEAQMNRLRQEDLLQRGVDYRAAQQAELQQAAAEAAARRPTSGEVLFDLDPMTGKLVPVSQGIKGATPETFSNFGSALETAANKVTAGKRFDLTAAEKVAWEKTKVDLSEVAPGFKALSDKAIAEKMMDRAWVEQTARTAREKAAAFEQLAARAKDERARQAAIANRERMMDLADQMDESLRAARPDVSGKQQGPKTREFQRNRLRGDADQEILNQLLGK